MNYRFDCHFILAFSERLWKRLGIRLGFFCVLLLFPFGVCDLLANPKNLHTNHLTKRDEADTLERAIQESIQYLQKLPTDTEFLIQGERYSPQDILSPLLTIQKQLHKIGNNGFNTEFRKYFQEIELKPSDDLPLITGYYEVRIQGRTKPQGKYMYPALVLPKQRTNESNPQLYSREFWKEKNHWQLYSEPIVFLTLTDLHLAQLEGSALVQTEKKEMFRINYAGDNGLDYQSPALHLTGICPSLKPYHLSQCWETKPQEVTDAIWKNPRYIFFEKESVKKKKTRDTQEGPLGSGGIRLIKERSVAMDKQIPLGFPVLLSFLSTKQTYHDHLAFVHDRGNAIQGEGRVDFYLGNGFGIDEVANQLLTKGKVVLLVPKKMDCQPNNSKECERRQSKR